MHNPQPSKHTNRLAAETSPYLLQHAHNPVDWYAWGADAFEAARKLNKPIFLSVGYSTCYWCHVMERQCFENEQIAAEMNQRFINIKVDREERPDVDQLYMNAVQVITHQGGWPMSVFLTPDLRPFYGGTYFPPTDMHGRPGFPTILRAVEGAYRERPADVDKSATQLVKILQQMAEPQTPDEPLTIDNQAIESWVERAVADYEPQFGGFGSAPKFPRQTLLEMLLVHQQTHPNESRMKMIRHALDAMADGGIHDHLGGGFHRYSTDAQWLVPHFEIMLYDNAMLAWVYAEAFRQTGETRYAQTSRGILDFVLREMTSPRGAFYTAFDAEVDAKEGLSNLWTAAEIVSLLGSKDAELFNHVYGLDRGPNFTDPHHDTGQPDKSILYLPEPLTAVAASMKISVEELDARLRPMREKLYTARRQRKQPLLDTKIITSWNALMIRALAHAGRVLSEPRYVEAAARAANFLLSEHLTAGVLCRTSRNGVRRHDGFLDDYAFLIQALFAMRVAGADVKYVDAASSLSETMRHRFEDRENGGFYFSAQDAPDLIVRQKVASDSPLPSGNAVTAMTLLELGKPELARSTLAAFARQLESYAEGMSSMVEAAIIFLRSNEPFVVSPGLVRPHIPTPQQRAAEVLTLEASWPNSTELRVALNIAEGYHINAREPAKELIATQLSVVGDLADQIASIDYPPLREYRGRLTIAVRFKQSLAGGQLVRLAITYQACDDSSCLPPITKQFEVSAP
jgi:hypothetical protein